eukprot:43352-Eustigmatos_ZCMA.PRE.1
MTNNSTSGFTASSNVNNSTAYYCFDSSNSTYWSSSNYPSTNVYSESQTTTDTSGNVWSGDYVQLALGSYTLRPTFILIGFNGNYQQYQASTLLGSTNGTTWASVAAVPHFSYDLDVSYTQTSISSSLYYSYYRVVFRASAQGAVGLGVSSIAFTGCTTGYYVLSCGASV